MTPALLLTLLVGVGIGVLIAGLWARRRADEQRRALEEARRRLAEARAAREAFFDLTTHELRSPLSAILGYQELLHDGAYGELSERGKDAAHRLGGAARHLLNLIDGAIELGRMRTGEGAADLEDVDLAVVFSSAADAFRAHATERGLEPTVELPSLPVLRTDQGRLVQALDLVITSAVRHPAGNALTLRVTEQGGAVAVTLEPTNIEVNTATDDPAVQLGIRLAVARQIGELLGGGLDLEIDDGRARRIRLTVRDQAPAPPL